MWGVSAAIWGPEALETCGGPHLSAAQALGMEFGAPVPHPHNTRLTPHTPFHGHGTGTAPSAPRARAGGPPPPPPTMHRAQPHRAHAAPPRLNAHPHGCIGRGGRGGGEGGLAGTPPSSQRPPVVPAKGGPSTLKFQSSWHQRCQSRNVGCQPQTLEGGEGGGVHGGAAPLLLWCMAVLIHHCPYPPPPAGGGLGLCRRPVEGMTAECGPVCIGAHVTGVWP